MTHDPPQGEDTSTQFLDAYEFRSSLATRLYALKGDSDSHVQTVRNSDGQLIGSTFDLTRSKNGHTSFAARDVFATYPALVDRFSKHPAALFERREDLGLGTNHLMLLLALHSWKYTADMPFPSQEKLEARTGLSPKTLQRLTKELEDWGYLIVVRSKPKSTAPNGKKRRQSHTYNLHPLYDCLNRLEHGEEPEQVRRGRERNTRGKADRQISKSRKKPTDHDDLATVVEEGTLWNPHGTHIAPRRDQYEPPSNSPWRLQG